MHPEKIIFIDPVLLLTVHDHGIVILRASEQVPHLLVRGIDIRAGINSETFVTGKKLN